MPQARRPNTRAGTTHRRRRCRRFRPQLLVVQQHTHGLAEARALLHAVHSLTGVSQRVWCRGIQQILLCQRPSALDGGAARAQSGHKGGNTGAAAAAPGDIAYKGQCRWQTSIYYAGCAHSRNISCAMARHSRNDCST
jgi:hypothetical protein